MRISLCEVCCFVYWAAVLAIFKRVGFVAVPLGGVSSVVVVNLCDVEIGMVVLRPVHFFGFVYEGVGFEADSLYVEVGDIEDVVFRHQWFRWCSWWSVHDYSDDFLLHFGQWLQVLLAAVGISPYRDALDEMWVDVGVV